MKSVVVIDWGHQIDPKYMVAGQLIVIDELPVVNAKGKVSGLLDVQDLLAQGFMLT